MTVSITCGISRNCQEIAHEITWTLFGPDQRRAIGGFTIRGTRLDLCAPQQVEISSATEKSVHQRHSESSAAERMPFNPPPPPFLLSLCDKTYGNDILAENLVCALVCGIHGGGHTSSFPSSSIGKVDTRILDPVRLLERQLGCQEEK